MGILEVDAHFLELLKIINQPFFRICAIIVLYAINMVKR